MVPVVPQLKQFQISLTFLLDAEISPAELSNMQTETNMMSPLNVLHVFFGEGFTKSRVSWKDWGCQELFKV